MTWRGIPSRQDTPTRVWGRSDSHPRTPRHTRHEPAYGFGAVRPEPALGGAQVLPDVNRQAMSPHLEESGRTLADGAHAVPVLGGAGWRAGPELNVPGNITLPPLSPLGPELNPTENIREYLRGDNRAIRPYDTVIEVCCKAWNDLVVMPVELSARCTPRRSARYSHGLQALADWRD